MEYNRTRAELLHPVILSVAQHTVAAGNRQRAATLSRLARQAAVKSAGLAGLALEKFAKDQDGVPLPRSGTYWSLSHKAEKVAGLAARQPVGIDIEKIRPVHQGLYRRIASGPEWKVTGGKNLQSLFRIWTAKEAVLKAEGHGLAGLAHCSIVERVNKSGLVADYRGRRWQVEQILCQSGFIVAVACAGAPVRWHFED